MSLPFPELKPGAESPCPFGVHRPTALKTWVRFSESQDAQSALPISRAFSLYQHKVQNRFSMLASVIVPP